MVRAEIPRKCLPRDHSIEDPTQRETIHGTRVDNKSDDAPCELVHHDQHPMSP